MKKPLRIWWSVVKSKTEDEAQAYRGAPPGYIIVTDQLQADHSAGRIRINNKRRDGIKEVALIGAATWAGSAVIGGGFGLLMNWAGAPHWGALGFSAVVSMISWRNITDLLEQSRN